LLTDESIKPKAKVFLVMMLVLHARAAYRGAVAGHEYLNFRAGKPLGKGSTIDPSKGRYPPRNLSEKLAIEEAMRNPQMGKRLPLKMGDPRWHANEGWVKMEYQHNNVKVHYVRNTKNGAIDDFKIVSSNN